jgi:hypothetical protein
MEFWRHWQTSWAQFNDKVYALGCWLNRVSAYWARRVATTGANQPRRGAER